MKKEKQLAVLECLATHKYKVLPDDGVILKSSINEWGGDKYAYKPKKALTLPNGYKQHILFKGRGEGKGVICYEHIIIYLSVYGEYPEGKVIDHIDNNPSNNRISNLQCLTPEQNKTKSPTSRANVKCKRIRSSEIAAMIELFKQGRSSLFISKLLEINRVTVQYYKKKWVNGERFKYLED